MIISLDLLHAYLHVPIHPSLGKFLFYFVLFSVAVSPRVFTRVVVTCVRFLDDWLLRNQQVDHLMVHAQSLLYVTARLSCIPSLEKLTPIQDFVFIDTHYRSNLGWMFLPEAGSEKQPVKFVKSPGKVCYSWEISLAVGETGVNIRSCAPGLSQVSASSALHISSLAPQSGSETRQDSLGSPSLRFISEMVDQVSQCSSGDALPGSCLRDGRVHRCLHQRLGRPCGSQSSRGLWLGAEITRHINELKLLAIQKPVRHFLPLIRVR